MRLLVEVSSKIEDWYQAFTSSIDRPRFPWAFSSAAAFFARGHEVSVIHLSDRSFAALDPDHFRKFYGPRDLKRALAENDMALLWTRSGIKAVVSEGARLLGQKKVILTSYV